MPIFHSPKPPSQPGHYGEVLVYEKLQEINFDELEVWNTIFNLPGVPDIDLILFDPENGFYLIEVKSYDLDNLISLGAGKFASSRQDNDGNSKHHEFSPIKQVKNQQVQLISYFRLFAGSDYKKRIPFLQTTILWSNFSKQAWLTKFNDEYHKDLANRMMFADDITSSHSLKWKLENLRQFPLLGTNVGSSKDHGEKIEFFRSTLASKELTQLSEERKRELNVKNETALRYASKYNFKDGPYLQVFTGPPGMGKTTILREIGLDHAKSGAAVLYICFNKVLAAEQRREIQYLIQKNLDGYFDAVDLWQFVTRFNVGAKLSFTSDQNLDLLKSSEEFLNLEYDTILIDEAQDLPNLAFNMLDSISKVETSLFISNGPGQEQYENADGTRQPERLKYYLDNSIYVTNLRRNFRSARTPFLISQAFWETAPDTAKGIEWIKKRITSEKQVDSDMQMEFEVPNESQKFFVEYVPSDELYSDILKYTISREINELETKGKPLNLLVIVANEADRYGSYKLLIETLKDLQIPYTDYVPDVDRRKPSDLVRITTHINSRGLTADTVLLLDFEYISTWIKKMKDKKNIENNINNFVNSINNLGYVALSRARQKTVVLIDTSRQNEITDFLQKIYYWLKNKQH